MTLVNYNSGQISSLLQKAKSYSNTISLGVVIAAGLEAWETRLCYPDLERQLYPVTRRFCPSSHTLGGLPG